MSNEKAISEVVAKGVQTVDMATITEYLDSTGLTKSLLPKEKSMFINIAQSYGLNPFKREIYCTAYGEGQYRQCAIVTGYEVYLKRAERTKLLDGWEVESNGSLKNGDLSSTVIIYRKDWSRPFKHTVFYEECVNKNKNGEPNAIWKKQPIFMTKKVAIAQGFRLCFSDEFNGMPYTNDELGIEEKALVVERNITPKEVITNEEIKSENVIAPNNEDKQPSDAYLALEKLVDDYDLKLQGDPYKLATDCLKNPDSTDDDYKFMYDRCVTYLRKKNVKI